MKQYKNRKWLQKQYLDNELSARQIAEICNCGTTTIRYWLKKLYIPIRSPSKGWHLVTANHCNLSEEAKQWIDGELLGDGCLYSSSKYSARFQYSSKYKEYIKYISNTLKSFGVKQAGKIHRYYYKKWDCYYYSYMSLRYEELLSIYKRWYPQKKKIIPKDLKLTPLTLRQEMIGDGSLHHYKGTTSIKLYTNGFPTEDVNWLTEQLNKLGFKSTRRPADNAIGISIYSTKQFLDYIGKSPVRCYNYKFQY